MVTWTDMTKYTRLPKEVEAFTFDEFVEYGRQIGANIVNGMPWSFTFHGYNVTHENDECYLIPADEGSHRFTPEDMLILEDDMLDTYPISQFELEYKKVDTPYDCEAQKELDKKHALDPQAGDCWIERTGVCIVLHVVGQTVIICKEKKQDNEVWTWDLDLIDTMTKDEFNKWLAYDSIEGYWAGVSPKSHLWAVKIFKGEK